MKWIIVDLFQDPKASASKTNDSTTVDVDAIESVTRVRRRVNRSDVFVSEVTTDIKLRDGMTVECIDSFKDVIAAIQLARNTEAIQRQAGNVFSTCIIDVREMVTEGLKEAIEEEKEPVEEVESEKESETLRFPRVGDVIVGKDVFGELVIKYYHPDYIEVQKVGDSSRSGFIYSTEWHKYKIVRKGESNVQ